MSGIHTGLDTNQITEWHSIVTLVVFVITNIIVLFPFTIPLFLPRKLLDSVRQALRSLRIIAPKKDADDDEIPQEDQPFVRLNFPMNFVTAPLFADLFLLAIVAIGREEVKDGTLGADHISPVEIMVFFITLAYIAISIDASGLIRYLAFKVLQKGGKVGAKLFFYLYAFFFALTSCIGNDPIILSGTAFLAYMTRVSSNIKSPRAWIHTQFAIANIASAILVSSNPTNLVLAGAFEIKFITYTANMIVPVVGTAIILFPILLYIVFADESLIPLSIKMHELSDEAKAKKPVNPNIPHARGTAEEEENDLTNSEQGKLLSLEEIMNPFVDKGGAAFGAVIMATALVTLVAINAASQSSGEHPVYWVTLPAAFVMFCWDLAFGWRHRHETREIARKGRLEVEHAQAERVVRALDEKDASEKIFSAPEPCNVDEIKAVDDSTRPSSSSSVEMQLRKQRQDAFQRRVSEEVVRRQQRGPATLVSFVADGYRWCQETLPTVTAVVAHLPFALIPFAFSMFVLVQALVSKGWVNVFAYGWDHWVTKTGTVGSIGGMGFLSVIMCNFAGTNIGTTILLSRVIQQWFTIHQLNGVPISRRTWWGTIYSMALGVNYGAFSTAFSASLAGLLWRDILARKHIRVRSLDFARVNLPIIAVAMSVGCTILIGEVYIIYNKGVIDLG